MEFKSYADLEADVVRMLPNLPRDLDLIVAVPRSGLVPASMIALHLNLPLTDLEGLYDGRMIASGHRKLRKSVSGTDETPLKVLIVDDSVGTGAQMREIRAELARRKLPHKVQVAVIYATPTGAPLVDFYGETVPVLRHFFAWNVMHHSAIGQWCIDIDGVLCRDCTFEEDDEAARYERFLQSAEPLYLPTARIGWIVTGRLEKYRTATEGWLHKHGITYDKLIMHPAESNEERKENGGIGRFKGNFYKSIESGLFIEGCAQQANKIANTSGKPVLCMETRSMAQPNTGALLRKFARKGPAAYFRYARRLFENYKDQNRNAGFAERLQTASGDQIQKNDKT